VNLAVSAKAPATAADQVIDPADQAVELPQRGTRLPRSARRAQLLGAAREVFVAQGFHSAAMDDIADRAGVSKPVLYQHFPGKLDLYLALLDASIEALLAAVRDGLAGTTDNKLRVTATTQAYFDFVSDPGGAFRLVFESDLTSEPSVRARVERVLQECAEVVSEVIAEDAGLSAEQSHLLAVGLIGSAQVTARYWVTTGEAVPKDDAVQLVSTLAWRGLSRFPRAGG
jgi:AcrR family transcriptional regulator